MPRKELMPAINALIEAIAQHGTGRRRDPSVEMSGEDAQLAQRRRLVGTALGRDLQRNVAPFRGLMRQFETCAVGAHGPRLHPAAPREDEAAIKWAKEAVGWWRQYVKWCDAMDDTPFAELVSQALTAGKREGDILWVFDDFDRDDGTLRIYESDQMPTVSGHDWDQEGRKDRRIFPWKEPNEDYKRGNGQPVYKPMTQKNGVVRDRRGRVHFYVFSPDHGKDVCKLKDVSIVAAWNLRRNPEGSAKLYKNQWRKSYRGSADATTFSTFQHDVYEMVSHALQSAKAAHQTAVTIESDPSKIDDSVERALLQAGIDPEKVIELAEEATEDGSTVEVDSLDSLLLARNYERIEKLTGGYTEYLSPGERAVRHASDQPGQNIEPFSDWLQGASGYALGLGRSRSSGKAHTSYTAFRGEELMSWAQFAVDQKKLERRLLDFVVYKALKWAVRQNEIASPPQGLPWWTWLFWEWPVMPEVDIVKAANAERVKMKNGSLTWSDTNGPDWRVKMESHAEQVEKARDLNLPYSMFETVAGAASAQASDEKDESDENGEPENGNEE